MALRTILQHFSVFCCIDGKQHQHIVLRSAVNPIGVPLILSSRILRIHKIGAVS